MAIKVRIDSTLPPKDIRAIANWFVGLRGEVEIDITRPTQEHLSRNEVATPDEEC